MYKMHCQPLNAYARWRRGESELARLGENRPSDEPSENLLQAIWQHQRLRRDDLCTLDGQSLRILHPGFRNREAGPDFRDAVLQFQDQPPCSGDIEVDVHSAFWRAHGHHTNPAYESVRLHVVWRGTDNPPTPPATLALHPFLDAPLDQLQQWLTTEPAQTAPRAALDGQCHPCLRQVPGETLHAILHQSAQVRLLAKAAQFEARARQAGWEQALWEGLFRALGYKQNIWPMHRLAEMLPEIGRLTAGQEPSVLAWQARWLGLSGLLPADLSRSNLHTDHYVSQMWSLWWRERDALQHLVLPRKTWRLNNLRPANHPGRRLALAAHWLAAGNLPARLEAWFAAEVPPAQLPASLLEILQVKPDPYWSTHYTLRSRSQSQAHPLLGMARATDLALNTILPWLQARIQAGHNSDTPSRAEACYFAWPKAEDNSKLRLARQRLFGGARCHWLHGGAEQQGVLQIAHDYCDQSNAVCSQCRFPEFIQRSATAETGGARTPAKLNPNRGRPSL
jgi:hypothetical protein